MNFELPRHFPLLPRKKDTDKSHYGHTLVVAGSRTMMGAAVLTARAALRSGSGLVTLTVPTGLKAPALKALPEALSFQLGAFPALRKYMKKRRITALAVGPGLSTRPRAAALARSVVLGSEAPLVLDADGLNAFKNKAKLLKRARAALVLTPHRGEFERLFGQAWPRPLERRAALAKKLSRLYHVLLVLKGRQTLVVEGDKVYVNSTGNPGMAKGGSGDVLTGMIASFISQGLSPFLASVWAVHLHGLAGDLAVKDKGELGLAAGDLIDYLPKAFKKVSR